MTLQTPEPAQATVAARYAILGVHDDEALGRVWTGRDLKTGRLVQVKVLTPDLAADPERFARFGREMIASYAVSDPNTIEVLDYGVDRGSHFLVLEFTAGTPLADVVSHGRLAPERVARIVVQIARALAAAHLEGVVHRSLSPETVILLDNAIDGDFVKVRDFGLSKLLSPEPDPQPGVEITATGTRVGDARYMPPEYVVHGQFGPKGDLYALGAVAFHLLTGEPPYVGSRRDMLARHVSGAVPRPIERVPDVPGYLDRLVALLLDKSPDRRPDVREIITRIEAGLGELVELPALAPLDAQGRVQNPRKHVQALPRRRRNIGLPGFGALGTLALGVLLVLVAIVGYTVFVAG